MGRQGLLLNKWDEMLFVLVQVFSVPGYRLLAAAPVEANVRRWEGGARCWGAGLMTVRGGAVALIRRHAITAVAVEPYNNDRVRQTFVNCF